MKLKMVSLLCILLSIACTTEESETLETNGLEENSITENVTSEIGLHVEDGILFFKNETSFKNQLEALHAMTSAEQESWLTEIGFSNSLYQETKDLTIEEILEKNYVEVPDRVFSLLLNVDGVYVVENTAHKILQYEELTMSTNEFMKDKTNWDKKDAVKSFDIYYADNDYLNPMNSNSRTDFLYSRKPYDGEFVYINNVLVYVNLGVTHLSAHMIGWNRGYVGYATFGVKIKGRKKRRGKWGNDDMHYASINYDAWAIGDFGDLREEVGFKSGTNQSDVQKTIFWKIGGRYSQGHIAADFEYEDDGYLRVRSDISGYGFTF